MYKNYITIAGILERLMRHPLLRDLSYSDASAYAVECLNNIGSPNLLTQKGSIVEIYDYKGELPDDYVSNDSQVDGIRRITNTDPTQYTYSTMRVTTDSFHMNYSKDNRYYTAKFESNNYTISGNIITTGFREGKLDIAYKGLATTGTGEILIPRNPHVIKAIEEYIKQEYFRILSDLGKIDYRTYSKAEQEYCWAIAKASSQSKNLTIAERENLSNMLTKFITTDNDYEFGFSDLANVNKGSGSYNDISTSNGIVFLNNPTTDEA